MHQTFMIPRALTGMRELEAPYHFPRIVHQTVKNKSNLACEVVDGMVSWRDKNPGYEHKLFDDKDCDDFVAENYPEVRLGNGGCHGS